MQRCRTARKQGRKGPYLVNPDVWIYIPRQPVFPHESQNRMIDKVGGSLLETECSGVSMFRGLKKGADGRFYSTDGAEAVC